jgi:hypothetical protein
VPPCLWLGNYEYIFVFVILVHLFWDDVNQNCKSKIINSIGTVSPPLSSTLKLWKCPLHHIRDSDISRLLCYEQQLDRTVDLHWSYWKRVTIATEVSKTTGLSRAMIMTAWSEVIVVSQEILVPLLQQWPSHVGCLVPRKILTNRQACPWGVVCPCWSMKNVVVAAVVIYCWQT